MRACRRPRERGGYSSRIAMTISCLRNAYLQTALKLSWNTVRVPLALKVMCASSWTRKLLPGPWPIILNLFTQRSHLFECLFGWWPAVNSGAAWRYAIRPLSRRVLQLHGHPAIRLREDAKAGDGKVFFSDYVIWKRMRARFHPCFLPAPGTMRFRRCLTRSIILLPRHYRQTSP